jgi:hypothetical protein
MHAGKRGRGRGRGGEGRHHHARQLALTVVVDLDETLRGRVIGPQGATVKATQQSTKAQIQAPRRGEPGPVRVSGEHVSSVLHACCLIARQTGASSSCVCTVPELGELVATLHATNVDDEDRRMLFQASSSNVPGAFVAYVLPSLPPDVSRARVASILDDLLFGLGTPPDGTFGQAIAEDGDLYVFGVGPGTSLAEGLYRELQKQVYTLEAASLRALERAARAAEVAEAASALSAAVRAAPSSISKLDEPATFAAALESGELAVVPCRSKTDLLGTFPSSPVDGHLHLVVNPGFDAVPLPFIPVGWVLARAHWPHVEAGEGDGESWTGLLPGGSLLRRGFMARSLCFTYIASDAVAEREPGQSSVRDF